jgi:hypothetical protein
MNNPPAFPDGLGKKGMTLRDYFAAKAMQDAISGCAARGEVIMYSELAGLSYEVADAMLKAREQ